MRPLAIINMTPVVQGGLRVVDACERHDREHLGGKAAVEALILAAPLWMVGLGVNGLDAELEQPEAQRGPLARPAAAPG